MGDKQQQNPEKCNSDLYWVASTYVISPIWNIYGSPDIIDPGMRNPRWLIQLNWGTVPITLYWTVHTQPKIYTRVMINNDYSILKFTICNNPYTSKPVLNIWFACIYGQSFPSSPPCRLTQSFYETWGLPRNTIGKGWRDKEKSNRNPWNLDSLL